jgi:hypothetical protein
MDCSRCYGNGDIECTCVHLDGAGNKLCEHNYGLEDCPVCQDSGRITCYRCAGSGIVD